MYLNIKPLKVLYMLLCISTLLVISNIVGLIYIHNSSPSNVYYIIKLFDLDRELNIPSFFALCIILFSSSLLFLIGLAHKRMGNRYVLWILLSFVFLYLSFDEAFALHERLIPSIRNLLNTHGYLYFAWVIPYSICTIILLFIYINFLMQLPKPTLILFLVSGAIYISGAIGMELIGGNHAEKFGMHNITYYIYAIIEEMLEMIGMSMFIYALLSYISIQFKSLEFRIY